MRCDVSFFVNKENFRPFFDNSKAAVVFSRWWSKATCLCLYASLDKAY